MPVKTVMRYKKVVGHDCHGDSYDSHMTFPPVLDPPDDARELREFIVANYDTLLRRVTQYAGCAQLAADSLHDIWVRLADKGCGSEPILSAEAYIYRMACNRAIDLARSERIHQGMGFDDILLDGLADAAPGPEKIAEARSEVRRLIRAVELLPPRRQAIFIGVRVENLSRREVAARHGVTLALVTKVVRDSKQLCPAF